MKINKFIPTFIFLGLFSVLAVPAGAADKYVKIAGDQAVDIRTAPQPSATVVCRGLKGDVFRLLEPEGDWYRVEMFSGQGRYLRKSAAQVTTFRVSVPRDFSKRKAIYNALFEAEVKAQEEALKPDQWGDSIVDTGLFRILVDRYKLLAMRRFSVQPPIYEQIRQEGPKFQK